MAVARKSRYSQPERRVLSRYSNPFSTDAYTHTETYNSEWISSQSGLTEIRRSADRNSDPLCTLNPDHAFTLVAL